VDPSLGLPPGMMLDPNGNLVPDPGQPVSLGAVSHPGFLGGIGNAIQSARQFGGNVVQGLGAAAAPALDRASAAVTGAPPPVGAIQMPTQEITSGGTGDLSFIPPQQGLGTPPISSPMRTVNMPASNTPRADPSYLAQLAGSGQDTLAAIEAQKAAAKQLGEAQIGEGFAKAGGLAEEGKSLAQSSKEAQTEAAAREAKAQERLARIDQASAILAQQKIDPDRYWNSRSTVQKVGLSLASMLGGFVQGMKGGPNVGMETINKGIDEDIASQRADMESGRHRLEDMSSLYARAYQATGDHDEAARMSRGILLESLKTQAAAHEAAATTDEQKANAANVVAKLDEERAKAAGAATKEQIALHAYSPGGAVTVGVPAANKEDLARSVTVGGQTLLAPDKEAAAKLRPEIAAYANADKMLKRAQELRADPNWQPWVPGNPQQRELEDLQARLPLAVHSEGVRMNPEIISRLEETTKHIASSHLNPLAIGTDEALAMHRKNMQEELQSVLAAQPLEAVRRGVEVNPQGQIVRTQTDTGTDYVPTKKGVAPLTKLGFKPAGQ
jgi:hypothetical protein